MKKLSIIAAAAAIAAVAAAPVAAQENTQDPFVSTAGPEIPALAIIGGIALIIAIAAAGGTD
ncbi:hypothetical protein [Antarctobacter heliothermus]|uniref:Ferrochelatase n=1 Tax=Antarctobacter heliothermus TaxID=74033 RepID=A0A239BVH8_9RHOB|nr:hypothetical protein [Antarctobacter heliothermus]SNS11428.1 hypothetical protein SAMN04488078_1004145 [Antarctobacter heliothermus]